MPAVDITVFFAITGFDVECATIFLISSILSAAFYRKTKEQRDLYTLMSVTQTSLVRDLKSGPAEVNGRVIVKDQTLSSPWSNRKCAYYRFHVEQDSSNGWMTCIDDTSLSSFFITDETGEIEIICNDGKMDLRTDRNSKSGVGNDASSELKNLLKSKYQEDTKGLIFNKSLRYTETYLEPDDKVYVFGQAFRTVDGRWVMRHGEMPLIVSENQELSVQAEKWKGIFLFAALSICSVIIAVVTVVFWVLSKT